MNATNKGHVLCEGEKVWLGIDMGTTSVKAVLVDAQGRVLASASDPTHAQVISDIGSLGDEQSPETILLTVNRIVLPLIKDYAGYIQGIGVTGQMHGVVLWGSKCESGGDNKSQTQDISRPHSNLFTWQDQRCSSEFLGTLPKPRSTLSTGYGCATLYWLLKNCTGFFNKSSYVSCGTIMDYFVCCLCDLNHSVTSDQLATSFGYYDEASQTWDKVLLEDPEFPAHLLPKIVPIGSKVGQTCTQVDGWPQGVPVYVSMGDFQCAMYALLRDNKDAAMNISTSIQLGFVMSPSNLASLGPDCPPSLSFIPYFEGQYLALCAGLNGGNVLGYLADCIGKWFIDLGFVQEVSTSAILQRLQDLAEKDQVSDNTADKDAIPLKFLPTFFGERHDTSLRGCISGLSSCNFSNVGQLFRAASQGLLDHLHSMITAEFLVRQGISRLLVSGSVPAKNSIVKQRLKDLYSSDSLCVIVNSDVNEAVGSAEGAALYVRSVMSEHGIVEAGCN